MPRPYTAPPLHAAPPPRILRPVTIQMTCPTCRAEIPTGSAFCPTCGNASPTVITNERVAAPPPSSPSPEGRGSQGVRTPGGSGGPTAVPTAERLARALGPKYQVKRLVGRGGFAEVYELWDQELDRRLACKVLHPEIAWTPGMLTRFRQEAKALARLQHPAILPIHFIGEGEGLVYYVMPFVEGESLADALRRRGSYAPDDALRIADPIPVASDVNARIPRWLSDAIVQCLAKQPDGRFQTADQALAALRRGRAAGSGKLVDAATVERRVRRSGAAAFRPGRFGWWVGGGVALVAGGLLLARGAGFVGSGVAFVHNALVEPVEILSDGTPIDTVRPDGSARLALLRGRADGGGARAESRWRLLRPGNPPIGEALEGPLPELRRVRGRRVAPIVAEVGGQSYFAPLVTNTTATDITIEVNPGTQAAVRCNCLVPKGAVRTHIGYYRLYRNSTIAAYNNAHPYIGPHADREGFAPRVAPRSGAVVLTF